MWTYDAYGVTFVSDCTNNNYKIASDYGKTDGKGYKKDTNTIHILMFCNKYYSSRGHMYNTWKVKC